MIRDVFQQLLSGALSRRQFLSALMQLGVGTLAASQMADVIAAVPKSEAALILDDVTGGRITCETLKLWDVEYVFGNTGAYEAGFVDALVDFPDIHYVWVSMKARSWPWPTVTPALRAKHRSSIFIRLPAPPMRWA